MKRTLVALVITYDDTEPVAHPRNWQYHTLLDLKANENVEVVFSLDKMLAQEYET